MPNAAVDDALAQRFGGDLGRLLDRAGLAADAPIGVALSGGPDSVALLLLAAARGPVAAMTVDHGLRPDSAEEAEVAAGIAHDLGVPHEVARVAVAEKGDGLQGEARRARYAALEEWGRREGLAAILTAHHADDQSETILMRLSRGAGLSGLAGIRACRLLSPDGGQAPWLLRPLLNWRKAELETIVRAAGISPARDPSNHNPRFDRTAARALLSAADGFDPRRIAASADHLADAEAALVALTRERAALAITAEGDTMTLQPTGLREIDRRLVLLLLAERFGKYPDGPAIERGLEAAGRGETITIADILWRAEPGLWRFRAAPPRRSV